MPPFATPVDVPAGKACNPKLIFWSQEKPFTSFRATAAPRTRELFNASISEPSIDRLNAMRTTIEQGGLLRRTGWCSVEKPRKLRLRHRVGRF